MARDAKGTIIDPNSPEAVAWCFVGAVAAEWPECWTLRIMGDIPRFRSRREQSLLVRQIAFEAGFTYAPTHPDQGDEIRWNNSITHPELIAGLLEAIRRYEAMQP